MSKMGHIPPRLGFGKGPPPDGDRLPMTPPDFEENHGQLMGIQNGLIVAANRG